MKKTLLSLFLAMAVAAGASAAQQTEVDKGERNILFSRRKILRQQSA